ncbi:hypothetical protein DPMN_161813 [Dreissena polymorpha]|uniref:Uncharacterized protein n=1 Tax=Dreissena polymorpha TaxID=45954 RepID=A0A9D4EQF4_DREPO|nr:hypothetical protein DPMN_161813 [Dreissena polymorpha]
MHTEKCGDQERGKRYRILYPKNKAGHHVVKPVKEACNYDYVTELIAELLQLKEQSRAAGL